MTTDSKPFSGSKLVGNAYVSDELNRLVAEHGNDALEMVISGCAVCGVARDYIFDLISRRRNRSTSKRLKVVKAVVKAVREHYESKQPMNPDAMAIPGLQAEPEPQRAHDRPWSHCYTVDELQTLLNGTNAQVRRWVERHCPDALKCKHCGLMYVHYDAIHRAREFAKANDWNGTPKWRTAKPSRKPAAPVPQFDSAPAKAVRRGFWQRVRLAWDVFWSASERSAKQQ